MIYSFGLSCIFLMGSITRDEVPTPILLRDGDILILSGHSRRCFHGNHTFNCYYILIFDNIGVPRVLVNTLPAYLEPDALDDPERDQDWDCIAAHLSMTRININLRQVIPLRFSIA
jgi:alkylated DNA repair protein alkB homolog 1